MPKVPFHMYQCTHCKWIYPAYFVNIMHTNIQEFNGQAFCGICALEIGNQIHGLKREKFDGVGAELMRQQAIEWREKHPYDDPAKKKQMTLKQAKKLSDEIGKAMLYPPKEEK